MKKEGGRVNFSEPSAWRVPVNGGSEVATAGSRLMQENSAIEAVTKSDKNQNTIKLGPLQINVSYLVLLTVRNAS